MNTYSFSSSTGFWHIYASNKAEAIEKINAMGTAEKATRNNVRLLHKGMY